MNNVRYEKPEIIEYALQILEKSESVLEFNGNRVKDDAVLLTWTFGFSDGMQADIKLCNGNSPYIDAVLFNKDGYEVMVLEPGDDLIGSFEFEYLGSKYIARIEKNIVIENER